MVLPLPFAVRRLPFAVHGLPLLSLSPFSLLSLAGLHSGSPFAVRQSPCMCSIPISSARVAVREGSLLIGTASRDRNCCRSFSSLHHCIVEDTGEVRKPFLQQASCKLDHVLSLS
ncbi:uncharacterized protein LOC21390095 isoform X1 [Morus notabilis]|uniref:uncharacterized protein LOC21390095 isoform X1 n=1 Tax=Morus notabilis TaxID=981085 RepID=UPI000CED770B|nr:uncharacterized protein LOC21390095 isoform X1 [Morus notabilis]